MTEIMTGSITNMPRAAAKLAVRYPWESMKPGDWFRFESKNLQSCRVRAAQMSRQNDMIYRVFVGADDGMVYCRREDGIDVDFKPKVDRDEDGNPVLPRATLEKGPAPQAQERVTFDDTEI